MSLEDQLSQQLRAAIEEDLLKVGQVAGSLSVPEEEKAEKDLTGEEIFYDNRLLDEQILDI